MPETAAHVTAAEISRIAGVTRATVSNWRRRHADFPAPTAGTDTSPLYDLGAVRAWLGSRGHTRVADPREELRTAVRLHASDPDGTTGRMAFVLTLARRPADRTAALAGLEDAELAGLEDAEVAGLTDAELAARASGEVAGLLASLPGPAPASPLFSASDGTALRALLRCVREAGAPAALTVLAERELDDSAATGVYGTPEPLARLVAALLPAGAARVLDPACGSGALLAAAAGRGAGELLGQDSVPVQARRAAVGLSLAAPRAEVTVRIGDSLRADAFDGLTADAVVCNPPYGDRDWGHDRLAYDPRWAYGVPGRSESELAWVQHCLAHLVPGGRAVLILPPATASRASGRRIRAELVRSGAVRAVLALPPGAAPPLHVGLHLWVLSRPEPGGPERKSVLFADPAGAPPTDGGAPPSGTGARAAGMPRTGTGPSRAPIDWAGLTARTLAHWEAFTADPDRFAAEPGTARTVPVVDLLDDLVDLTPARRVRTSHRDVDPAELSARTETGRRELAESARALLDTAGLTGWTAPGGSVREWRTANASDLARGGALTLLRTVPDTKGPVPDTKALVSDTKGPVRDTQTPEPDGSAAEPDGSAAVSDTQAPVPDGSAAAAPVLTGADIARGTGPTGDPAELGPAATTAPVIAAGDVLVRAIAGGGGPMARVADDGDAGALLGPQVHLLRPDPARLDSWFLAGFVGSAENVAGASTGSTVLHVAPGRLRVPLLPLDEQRRYGEAFRHVHRLRARARRAARLAEETAALLAGGLTGGALLPAEGPPPAAPGPSPGTEPA
ncbi:SAM-dependent methyltransferase [Streptomyces spongiicola]|uniref:SAM-dependent methyltransferase n=1 Tax=Streptomyces spongiicola TaxID=1690221 RepID=A0A388T4J8_9ACTN|nr:N-6 DNA methylase [Streptomyces spongiicola]GBQ03679.1 SAM-dependent methyltransferase [Streptomyces spongiicola]